MAVSLRGRSLHWIATVVIAAGLLTALLLPSNARAEELSLLAGAGLRQPLDVLTARFEQETGHRILTSYDGSGRLLARIEASGRGDLYMPGALFFLDRLERAGRIRSVRPLVSHTAVVGVALHATDRIRAFEDLAKPGLRLALGDPKAMAFGRTAWTMFRRAGLEAEILENVAVYGGTVKQLALYIARGDVDASIIGRADAFQFQDRIHIIPVPEAYFEPETIAVVVLSTTRHPDPAERFCTFLTSDEARAVFRRFGFLPLEE